ncbi:MAG: GntR family transcriptional regulator [Herbinix sp.]|nr:GntR family transcriptional regulator [Herbinix sp.]
MAKFSDLRFEYAIDIIEEYIDSHELKENDRLPAERQLSEEYNISRVTIREALKKLEIEGRIYKIPGKGHFIAPRKHTININILESFSDSEKRQGNIPENKVVYFCTVLAGEMIAKELEIHSEDEVYLLTRVRSINGKAILLESAYIPVKYVPGLSKFDFEKESLYQVLRKEYEIELVDQKLDIQLSKASDKEAQYLEIDPKEVVFVEKGLTKNIKNIPIEYTKSILVAKYVKYQIDLNRRTNMLLLNSLKLRILCENIEIPVNSYAECKFDDMYWGKVKAVLNKNKLNGNQISFFYDSLESEELIQHTMPFVDYAFFLIFDYVEAKAFIQRMDVYDAKEIIIFSHEAILIKDSSKICDYSVLLETYDIKEFQEKYLFGSLRGWDKDKCFKFALNSSEKREKMEE